MGSQKGELAVTGGTPVRREPYPAWPQAGPEEMNQLSEVLNTTRWFAGARGDDPESRGVLFGRKFAELHGAAHGAPVANGSVAIEIALRAAGLPPGAEVIVPAYTFVSTATSVLLAGGVPVFADIDPENYCLDPEDAARKIGPKTWGLLPVHLGGHMADMAALLALAENKSLVVIEDCAQAIGASLGDRCAGTWGAAGTFSFQSNKTITSGEGGLVMTNDQALAEKVAALRAFGRLSGQTAERSSDMVSLMLSSNYRLSEFQSAVLLAQLERFGEQDARRRAAAARLTRNLERIGGLKHVDSGWTDHRHGYYYYLIRYEPEAFGGLSPERLSEVLKAEGVPFSPGDQTPYYRQPVFEPENLSGRICPEALAGWRKSYKNLGPGLPEVEKACTRTLILRHQNLLGGTKDIDDLAEALAKVKKHVDELK